MDLSLNLQQQQKLVMTMQMHQAFQVLQLTGQELEDALLEEIRENPALELVDIDRSLREDEIRQIQEANALSQEETEARNGAENIEFDWQTLLENGFGSAMSYSGNFGNSNDQMPIEYNLKSESTLSDHLMDQFRLEFTTDGERIAGEFIIYSLDDSGFIDMNVDEISALTDVDVDDVEGAILVIRELEPIGCAAQNMLESLIFQAEILYPEDPFFPEIIRDHLQSLHDEAYEKVGQLMDMDPEDVEEYHHMLLKLNPRPGGAFVTHTERGITPDVEIVKVGDEWQVLSNDDGLPKIRISSLLRQLVTDKSLNKEDRAFADEYLKKAQFFIESLYRRERTIIRVTKAILDRQLEYFEFGEEYLRPLVLRQIAEDVSLHESTVSRSTANKYVQTPRGILELKWLFCSGVTGIYGEEYAAQSIQVKIRRFIDMENQQKPLSDQKIENMLADEGIQIARRTVAKYREMTGIPSSRDRKQQYLKKHRKVS